MLHFLTRICVSGCLLIIVVVVGCDPSQPAPKLGVGYWTVAGIGGPIEIRRLPPADQVVADFDSWINSETAIKARVYEAKLYGASNQSSFTLETRREETPVGRAERTYASFIYKDVTNGSYQFFWHRLGKHNADFLKLDNKPKRVWVTLDRMASAQGLPKLEIVAFEGVELGGGVSAEPGRKSP